MSATCSFGDLVALTSVFPPSEQQRSVVFQQSSQPFIFEAMYPVLHSPGCITEEPGNFQSTHALSHEQQPMQTVVVAGLRTTTNLILQPKDDGGGVCDSKRLHISIRSQKLRMRNYLLRRV